MRAILSTGILYLVFGIIFIYFAIIQINNHDWGWFAYVLIILATIDTGAGIRYITAYFKSKKKKHDA